MSRLLQILVLSLVFVTSGAPGWLVQALVDDDCGEVCIDEDGCPEGGCADCTITCSSCPRSHGVFPQAAGVAPVTVGVTVVTEVMTIQKLEDGPPPEGVFHPPRAT